ncbi:MAG: HAMP domain-containing protein, partial [Mariprofundaceae bacterium]|nr:HAMP domain-containing protein [Mariprofundaceae bacterium]
YVSDPVLADAVGPPVDYSRLNLRLAEIQSKEGWQRLQLFDTNDRLLTGVQESGLAALEAEPLDENAKLATALGRTVTGLLTTGGREVVAGYAPLQGQHGMVALLRAEITLPSGVVQSARSVEADYKTYRELERNRQAIQGLFTNTMLIVTLLVVLIAGGVAIVFARRLTSPIGNLAQALHRVTEGDLNVSIAETTNDELGSLAHSFNRMTGRLRDNMDALTRAQQELTEALNNSRQRRHILETLLANLQTGVLLSDADGQIRVLNEALKSLLNLPSGWLPGKDIASLCSGRLRGMGQFFDELRNQGQESLQRELNIAVGKKNLYVLARGARLHAIGASGLSSYLIVMDDVSSLAEAQRHKAWAEVARRLAHEIKNPLTPIKLAAERLDRRFSRQVEHADVFDACTHTIIGQVERLQRLISDFSTLARLPQPRLGKVSLELLLTEMRELYAPYKGVTVETFNEPVTCICDADQVRQVLINLLDNAIAATRENGGAVRLYAETGEATAEFHVLDEGEGVPDGSGEQIFEPYYSTKENGSGLGLAIAYRIAQDHEGDLKIESSRNPTHFCLSLPLSIHAMEAA